MTDENPFGLEGPSPITEADPNSLDILLGDKERLSRLMNTMPSKIDRNSGDMKVIVAYYRHNREVFLTDDAKRQAEAAVPKTKKSKATPVSIDAILSSDSF